MSLSLALARRCGSVLSAGRHCVRGIYKRCAQAPTAAVSVAAKSYSTEVLAQPTPSAEERHYPEKITRIVDDIAKLTLMEVADLNELLKKTLNIQETPMMAGAWAAAPAAAAPQEEDEGDKVAKVQTSFTVKLVKFEDSKKIQLIKEIKNLMEGINLVQAKKFVESAPQIVKADLPKDEAEKLKASIEMAGGTCEIV
ncbi:mitochondrial ribosomal protein L12 [Rhipicephalus microplus]|uniref:Large ribosomal subunit protein bL12m n=1 Tax=Rhipicephalus microplus TaxID=6941 RepID=A0A6M2CR89_RHIMP